jgi:hypothetical protein
LGGAAGGLSLGLVVAWISYGLLASSTGSDQPVGNGPKGARLFREQASYVGDCRNPPVGSACITYSDGYRWLVADTPDGKLRKVGAWEGKRIEAMRGRGSAAYFHILGTQYVKP